MDRGQIRGTTLSKRAGSLPRGPPMCVRVSLSSSLLHVPVVPTPITSSPYNHCIVKRCAPSVVPPFSSVIYSLATVVRLHARLQEETRTLVRHGALQEGSRETTGFTPTTQQL